MTKNETVAGAARHLFEEHRAGAKLDGLPADLWPADMGQAYAIQDALLGLYGRRARGPSPAGRSR